MPFCSLIQGCIKRTSTGLLSCKNVSRHTLRGLNFVKKIMCVAKLDILMRAVALPSIRCLRKECSCRGDLLTAWGHISDFSSPAVH
jgi:hypothetical protein